MAGIRVNVKDPETRQALMSVKAAIDFIEDHGGGGAVNSVTATAPIASTGGVNPVISLDALGVSEGKLAADAVSNAKLANMAASTIKGQIVGGSGDPVDMTATQARAVLNVADGANAYVHPNHSGEVTSVADGAQTITADAVTYAKMQNVSAADRLLGRGNGGGAGDPQEISLGTNLSMSGTTLNATGASILENRSFGG